MDTYYLCFLNLLTVSMDWTKHKKSDFFSWSPKISGRKHSFDPLSRHLHWSALNDL